MTGLRKFWRKWKASVEAGWKVADLELHECHCGEASCMRYWAVLPDERVVKMSARTYALMVRQQRKL